MVNSIFILDKSKTIVDVLSNNGDSPQSPFFNDKYIQDLVSGAETFEFTTVSNNRTSQFAVAGNYVAFKYKNKIKMFQIIDTKEEHEEALYKTCYCEIAGLELINNVVRKREIPSANVRQFFEIVLADTDWALGIVDASLILSSNIKIERATNVYSLIQEHLNTFDMEIEYRFEMSGNRISGMYIDVYKNRGRNTGKRYEYGVNVSGVSKQVDMSELCTAMVGIGTNDIDFKSVEWGSDKPALKPLNQDFIVDIEAHKQWNNNGSYIMGVYQGKTESPHELLSLTWNELQRRKEPKMTYNIDVEMLQGDDEEVNIGDKVKVIDNDYSPALHLTARIGKLELSFTDYRQNKCVLTNFKEVKSGILSIDTVQAIIDGKFPIGTEQIQDGAITGEKIENNSISGTHIQADTISAGHIEADSINTKHLRAGSIVAEHLKAEEIITQSAQIKDAIIDKAHIKDGTIDNAKIEDASINAAKIQDASIGTAQIADAAITTAKIGNAQIGTAQIKDASITNAKINNLSADKITAGDISSDRLTANVITAINASIGKINADKLTVGEIDAGNITTGSLDADRITSSVITAINGSIENATINNAKIGALSADKITSGSIATDRLKANVISAVNASIGNAVIDSAKIGNISADKITSGYISSDRIQAGSIDADKIKAGVINSIEVNAGQIVADKIAAGDIKIGNANIVDGTINGAKIAKASITNALIANATIESAKIKSIDAQKITTGKLDTSKVNVSSLSGNLSIADNTIQIRDNQTTPVVRVQLGEDATGDYGLIIKDRTGKVMWDLTGATANGIQNDAVTTDKIKDESISSNKLMIDEIWASEGFIDSFRAQDIDADRITTGTISGERIDINGMVSFNSLNNDLQGSFERDNNNKTWINGGNIKTGSLTADRINTRGFEAKDNAGNTTLSIDKDSGKVSMSGLVESIGFSDVEGKYRGYQLDPSGKAILNDAVLRGSVILPQAGITNADNTGDRKIRFWAGADYENRVNAPFIVYSDGKIKATEGEFGGTFTGKLEIGNIHIQDTNNSKGSFEIKTNNNAETRIHLEEDNSYIKSNLSIGTNFINFNTSNSSVDMKGTLSLTNSNNYSTVLGQGANILSSTDGSNKFIQKYSNGAFTFDSYSNSTTDYKFTKDNANTPVKVEVLGEMYARDKITMNNNIAIVSRQDSGNSGFDFVVK